jgi:signal transduction histidine kinase
MIPVFFMHFVLHLLEISGNSSQKNILRFCYVLQGLFIATIVFSPSSFFGGINPKLSFNFFPNPGLLYTPWMLTFFVSVIYDHMLIFKGWLSAHGDFRRQFAFFFFGNLLGYAGGIGCFLPVYGISVLPFPYGSYGVVVFSVVTAYTVLKHRFLEIESFLRKTVVFAGLVSFVFGTVTLITFLLRDVLESFLGLTERRLTIISILVIVSLYRQIEKTLTGLTDRYLFQKKYDYKALLRRFIDEVVTVLDLKRLVEMTVERLTTTMRLERCALFLLDAGTRRYQPAASRGWPEAPASMEEGEELVTLLQRTQEPLLRKSPTHRVLPERLVARLDQLHAQVCLPLVLHNELIGVLTLGKKKSDADYTPDDLDLLVPLAKTAAIAISNAQLVAEAAQKEKLALIGTLTAAINHEVCNPLNNAKVRSEGFVIKLRRGLLDALTKTELERKVIELLEANNAAIDQAAGVTTRLSNFAKPVREPTRESVMLHPVLKEVLAVLGHDLELKRIEVHQDIPPDLPPLSADPKQLQEILFNLLRNASQAIASAGTITIRAWKTTQERVSIEMADTGCGMDEMTLARLFTPFFTTKANGEGTGLGLFVVEQLVKRNEGSMTVRSRPGVGTTFLLEFPIHEPSFT